MKLDIEPGIVVEGSCGQRREVVKIEWPNLLFRQVSRGGGGNKANIPDLGETRWQRIKQFAFWAQREVTEVAE